MNTSFETLKSAMAENDSHLQRLLSAKAYLEKFFPMTVDGLNAFSNGDLAHLDQFLFRFSKMQDSLGTRLIPSLYSILEGDGRSVPFLDMLHRLEKLGVLTSEDSWQFFRNLRNNLAHDYPESQDQTVIALNTLFSTLDDFILLYKALRRHALARLNPTI